MKIKKYLLLGILLITIMNSCKKKDDINPSKEQQKQGNSVQVEQKQTAIVNKLTATWCEPCGSWGWDLWENIISDVSSKAIIIGTYGSSTSNFYNQAAGDFKDAFAPDAGWPAFCVNGINKTSYSTTGGIYSTSTQTDVKTAVDEFNNSTIIANAGYNITITGNEITLETKIKFFSDASGDYYLNAYIIENNALSIQNGQTGIVEHHYVLRGAAGSNTWGELVASGSISTNDFFDKNFSMIIEEDWDINNIQVALIIWKKTGTEYDFVNAYIK